MKESSPAPAEHRDAVPVWILIASLLLLYGLIVLGAGIEQWSHPPAIVLARDHATFWGGVILTVLSAIFLIFSVVRHRRAGRS